MKLCVMNCDGGHFSRKMRTCMSLNSTCMCDMNRTQSSEALGLLMAQSPVRLLGIGISSQSANRWPQKCVPQARFNSARLSYFCASQR
jgi:hypothetical protein